jgi:nucleotide-binding universal stress UspA family protein
MVAEKEWIMPIVKKILAPTDFSELSAKGVRYACQTAKEVGAEVVILNVVVLDETNTASKQEMEQHKQRLAEFVAANSADLGADLKIQQRIDLGQPYSAIVACAENEQIDLIIRSSHGRTGLSRMLIGSVTDKVLRGSPCPILVVPSGPAIV